MSDDASHTGVMIETPYTTGSLELLLIIRCCLQRENRLVASPRIMFDVHVQCFSGPLPPTDRLSALLPKPREWRLPAASSLMLCYLTLR